jgi:cyclophilin family peptidyl-prolyl cis-trans isomerase
MDHMKRFTTAALALTLTGISLQAMASPADSTGARMPAVKAAAPSETAPAATGTVAPKKIAAKAAPTSNDKVLKMIDEQIAKVDKSKADWKTTLPKPAMATFEDGKTYLCHMGTNKGDITIKFLPKVAPMHVTNFIYLSRLGFYDGLSFHRVITNFMAQGGDPLGNGSGGPGYQFGSEFSPTARHDKGGKLSMANAGQGTDGSQFFLTFVATPWLDDKHSIFGEVIDGMDVLKALEAAGSQSGRTSEPLKMTKVTIEVK